VRRRDFSLAAAGAAVPAAGAVIAAAMPLVPRAWLPARLDWSILHIGWVRPAPAPAAPSPRARPWAVGFCTALTHETRVDLLRDRKISEPPTTQLTGWPHGRPRRAQFWFFVTWVQSYLRLIEVSTVAVIRGAEAAPKGGAQAGAEFAGLRKGRVR
jgi:hypothetical protein